MEKITKRTLNQFQTNNNFIWLKKKSKVAEIKTKRTSASVEDFINNVNGEQKRKDSFVILEMMKKATREEHVIWSKSIISFGNKRYKNLQGSF